MESSPMRYVVACAFGLLCLTTASAAEIYCNAQGRDCRDRPSGNANIARTVTAAQAASNTATASNGTSDAASSGDLVAAQQQREAEQTRVQDTVQKDLADKRAAQCKKAQQDYQRAIEATTLVNVDKDGNKHMLTDAEIAQYRLNARLAIDQSCKTGS